MESLSLNFTLHPANYAVLTSPGLLSGAVQETFPIFIYQGCIALGKKIALGVPLCPPLFAPSPSLPPRRCTGGLPPAARLGTGAGPQAVPMPELAGSLRVGGCFAAMALSSLFVGFLLNINKNPESSAALLGEAQNNKMVSSTTWQEHGDEACREKCSVPPARPAAPAAHQELGAGSSCPDQRHGEHRERRSRAAGTATAAKGRSWGRLLAAAGFVCAACCLLQPQHSSSAAALAGWPAQQALSTAQSSPMADFTSAALLSDNSREHLGHGGCAVQQAAVYE